MSFQKPFKTTKRFSRSDGKRKKNSDFTSGFEIGTRDHEQMIGGHLNSGSASRLHNREPGHAEPCM